MHYTEQAILFTLQWRHNEHDGVSNHKPHHCLLNRLFRRRTQKTSMLLVTGICAGNSPVTGEFPHKWPVTRNTHPSQLLPPLATLPLLCHKQLQFRLLYIQQGTPPDVILARISQNSTWCLVSSIEDSLSSCCAINTNSISTAKIVASSSVVKFRCDSFQN